MNLFITVIITSKEKLRRSVLEENLFYMAQSSRMIQYTDKLISCRQDSKMNFNLVAKTFCVHKICGSKCNAEKVPYNIQVIEKKLRNIAAEKIVRSKKVMSHSSRKILTEKSNNRLPLSTELPTRLIASVTSTTESLGRRFGFSLYF